MKSFNLGNIGINRRSLLVAGTAALLAGCQVIPKGPTTSTSGPATGPTPEPSSTALPTDETRHRIALLVPLSGENADVGNSIANGATMALLDTNASNLRITTYDTSRGARDAARKAVADGNKLILGPLLANNVPLVLAEARPANIPLISYSNDATVAGPDVYVMGHIPNQSIERTVEYAQKRGSRQFAAIIPEGDYGTAAQAALEKAIRAAGGRLVATESYRRGNTSIVSAAQRIAQRSGIDTVLIADGARLAALAAGELKSAGTTNYQLLGTELLSGEASVPRTSALRGAWFSAVSDDRFKRYSDSYSQRFGSQPHRISTLGFDSVLLTLKVAQDWKVGRSFPQSQMYESGGFLGVDGPFRFMRSGVADRAMEVREVRDGSVVVVEKAPANFAD